jgi:hypothetical protein
LPGDAFIVAHEGGIPKFSDWLDSVELLPVLAAKHPSVPGRKRVALVLREIGTERAGAVGRWKGGSLLISQCTSNQGRHDVRDLIAVNESCTMFCLDDDPVEQIERGNLKNVLNGPELSPR